MKTLFKTLSLILLIGIVFLSGCTTTPDPETPDVPAGEEIDNLKVQSVVDDFDILIYSKDDLKITRESDRNEIQTAYDNYLLLNDSEKALVTNYEEFLEIKAMLDAYNLTLEEEKKLQEEKMAAIEEAKSVIMTALPTTTRGEDVTLPGSYAATNGINVGISWTSGDPQTITVGGKVIQPRGNSILSVVMTADFFVSGASSSQRKTVRVAPLEYNSLPDKPVFAYYYTNQTALTEDERKTIDVINLSFGEITTDGKISVNGLNTTTVLAERKNGKRVLFSVQNKQGFKTYATDTYRASLVQSFVDVVEKYHFDGVDIDWEYPEGATEISNYVKLVQELSTALKQKNRNYLLTSAVYGGNGTQHYNIGVSHQYLDYIHLMTYDMNSSNSSHLTALRPGNSFSSVEATVGYYTGAGVPKEKLVIGAAFYGKVYQLPVNGTAILGVTPISDPVSILYNAIRNAYLSRLGTDENITRYWDSAAQAPYLYIVTKDDSGTITARTFITYDDVESIKLKCEYLKSEDLAGIMFWELGYEDRSTGDLVNAIYDNLKK